MTVESLCAYCRHLRQNEHRNQKGRVTCAAFPEGIPGPILMSRVDHTKPYMGDNGIQFESLTQEEVDAQWAEYLASQKINP